MEQIYIKKKKLRQDILNIRNNMNESQKKDKDNFIREKFLKSEYYKKSNKIFIYISYSSEINTIEIINKALDDGKKIFCSKNDF